MTVLLKKGKNDKNIRKQDLGLKTANISARREKTFPCLDTYVKWIAISNITNGGKYFEQLIQKSSGRKETIYWWKFWVNIMVSY